MTGLPKHCNSHQYLSDVSKVYLHTIVNGYIFKYIMHILQHKPIARQK
jgi:hypothetical protein